MTISEDLDTMALRLWPNNNEAREKWLASVAYLRANRAKGWVRDQVSNTLLSSRWKAFKTMLNQEAPPRFSDKVVTPLTKKRGP